VQQGHNIIITCDGEHIDKQPRAISTRHAHHLSWFKCYFLRLMTSPVRIALSMAILSTNRQPTAARNSLFSSC